MAKLRKAREQVKEEGGGGLYFRMKDISTNEDNPTVIRLLPPRANMGGVPFLRVFNWWINKTNVTSPSTFDNGNDPIQEELDNIRRDVEASPTEDKELHALLTNDQLLRKSKSYYWPILLLDDNGKPTRACIMQANHMVTTQINDVLVHREYQNDGDGAADREEGVNLYISKSGKDFGTKYKVVPARKSTPMPENFYAVDAIPDVYGVVKKSLKSAKHQVSVLNNYLFGDPIVEDAAVDAPAAARTRPGTRQVDEAPAKAAAKRRDPLKDAAAGAGVDPDEDEEEEEDEAPAPPRRSARAAAKEEDETPAVKARRAATIAALKDPDEDEDEGEEEDEQPAPATRRTTRAAAPAPARRTTRRAANDLLDD